ncbi:hypothetical protein [Lysinibacillus sp. GbtcB16]|nr:hypothetical protein [Lysinibacillus sp. GbtcB16]
MFEECFENMSLEEQEEVSAYMEELFEAVALGNGDYTLNSDGEIVVDD